MDFDTNKKMILDEMSFSEDTVSLDLWYPRHNPISYLQVGLMDVRAADNIRISYDFERDGYVIEQAQIFAWDVGDEICDPKWIEVAFVQAWSVEKKQCEICLEIIQEENTFCADCKKELNIQ